MVALLDDVPVLHHHDDVGVADRRKPMCDHETRAVGAQVGHRLLDEQLGAGVHRAGGLVEDEDRRLGQERARDRDELSLTGTHTATLVVEDGVVAVGQRPDEVIDVAQLRGLDNLLA